MIQRSVGIYMDENCPSIIEHELKRFPNSAYATVKVLHVRKKKKTSLTKNNT